MVRVGVRVGGSVGGGGTTSRDRACRDMEEQVFALLWPLPEGMGLLEPVKCVECSMAEHAAQPACMCASLSPCPACCLLHPQLLQLHAVVHLC